MGGAATKAVDESNGVKVRRQTIWRKEESIEDMKQRFIEDGTFPPDVSDEYVELRRTLEEPVCQRFLGNFSKVRVVVVGWFIFGFWSLRNLSCSESLTTPL